MTIAPVRRRSRRPSFAMPVEPLDATLLDRITPRWKSPERVDLRDNQFERVHDDRSAGSRALKPAGIRLNEDLRSWLQEHEIAYGVHTDLNEGGGMWGISIDAYLILPNEDQRTLYYLRWGKES